MRMSYPTAMAESLGQLYIPERLLLLGMCPAHTLLQAVPPECRVDHLLWESHPYSSVPEIELDVYEAVVIGLTLRHILFSAQSPIEHYRGSDVLWTHLIGHDGIQAYFGSCAERLRDRLEVTRGWAAKKPLLFLSFIEPRENYLGLLMPKYRLDNPAYFIQRLNQVMAETIETFGNAYFIDVNEALNSVGRITVQDDYVNHLTHSTYMFDQQVIRERDLHRIQASTPPSELYHAEEGVLAATKAVVARIFDALKIIRQDDTIKLIMIDLDDTLWRGVAADEDRSVWGEPEGWPMGFLEALLVFKARGGLLAIVSKNDEAEALERLEYLHGSRLKPHDFAAIKINFEPKSSNIEAILRAVNILPANALFIDDNPREIDEVRSVFPDLRVLSQEHYDWRRRILVSPETQVPTLSAESIRRTENVQALIERERSKNALSRAEWLKSLDLAQHHSVIRSVEHRDFPRALELLNKTNQFNTTGQRWAHAELATMFSEGGFLLGAFLRDRMVDNGLIGVSVIKGPRIVQTVLSCRVFGLSAEFALLNAACAMVLEKHDHVVTRIEDSGKNFTCHGYFSAAGFEKTENGDSVMRTVVAYPAHIRAEWASNSRIEIVKTDWDDAEESLRLRCRVTNHSDTLWQFGSTSVGISYRFRRKDGTLLQHRASVTPWRAMLEPGDATTVLLTIPATSLSMHATIEVILCKNGGDWIDDPRLQLAVLRDIPPRAGERGKTWRRLATLLQK